MEIIHKSFWPMSVMDIIGTVFIMIGLIIASTGGIGGGGIISPLLILIFRFQPQKAIPLSNIAIFGASCINITFNTFRVHPTIHKRFLIDWETASILEPATMIGAAFGAILSNILPSHVLLPFMIILLMAMAVRYIWVGVSEYKKESTSIQLALERASAESDYFHDSDLESSGEEEKVSHTDLNANICMSLSRDVGTRQIYRTPNETTHLMKPSFGTSSHVITQHGTFENYRFKGLIWLFITFLGVSAINVFSHFYFQSNYLLTTFLLFSWIFILFVYIRRDVIKIGRLRLRQSRYDDESRNFTNFVSSTNGSEYNDIIWNERNTLFYPFMCIFAGLIAGLFGVGGGIIKSPLLLELGVHPQIASATSSTMIFFTSATALVVYSLIGTITIDYSIFLFGIALLSTTLGQFASDYIIRNYRRLSVISLSIGTGIAISVILMIFQQIIHS